MFAVVATIIWPPLQTPCPLVFFSVIYHFQIWDFDVVATLLNISNIKMLASFA
jgi:hypothetical protein